MALDSIFRRLSFFVQVYSVTIGVSKSRGAIDDQVTCGKLRYIDYRLCRPPVDEYLTLSIGDIDF